MTIPDVYAKILEKNQTLKGIVYLTISHFTQIFEDNRLYFFDEYTDHGIRHIEDVLASTINIVPESSVELFLDSENVAALILSVILHDIAMHHTFETFTYLIKQDEILVPDLDQFSWKELWRDYTEEAKKFSSQQKEEIFGDYDYLVTIPQFRNADELDGHQKKLIGEFLRRHHPRIAHEIANQGFKTEKEIIRFAENYDEYKLDIVGLIARSHGMEIRKTYDYLAKRFFKISRDPLGIHVFYLMTILRVADYFQIDVRRILPVSLKLKTFESPISEIEHQKHFAIKDIRVVDEDPESLYVWAQPTSNLVYWKLIDLIKDIQGELDKSWAVLGEKYGKETQRPLLRYRRIISNLQEKSFLDTVSFIPDKTYFKTDDDLAKLLVEPLYGNHPTYGVRELLQNSIDAIHERIFLEKSSINYDGKIEISIYHDSNETFYFEISDNGKGMDIKEIKNYFLKAGATNRKSKEWDNLYLDSENNSKILKSGKFGVGILAAFLIGQEIEVTTRKYDVKYGLHFKFNLNSKTVEVIKVSDCAIGTKIKICLQNEVLNYFKNPSSNVVAWDKWYTLQKPKVLYNCLLKYSQKYGNEEFEPGYFDENVEWIEFNSKGYNKIRWSYNRKKKSELYRLTCNGIIIPTPPKIQSGSIPPPNIQVFDFNGVFPINLNRNTLGTTYLPFEKDLIRSIFKQILKECLQIPPSIFYDKQIVRILKYSSFPELFGGLKVQEFFNGFIYTVNGYYLKNNYTNDLVKYLKVILLKIYSIKDNQQSITFKLNDDCVLEYEKIDRDTKFDFIILQLEINIKNACLEWAVFSSSINEREWSPSNKYYKVDTIQIFNKQYTVIKRNDIRKVPFYLGAFEAEDLESIQVIMCVSSSRYTFTQMNSSFNTYIRDIFHNLDNALLPYDEEERKIKIQKIIDYA